MLSIKNRGAMVFIFFTNARHLVITGLAQEGYCFLSLHRGELSYEDPILRHVNYIF